jgi:hypothetical protein
VSGAARPSCACTRAALESAQSGRKFYRRPIGSAPHARDFKGWENAEGEIFDLAIVLVVHPECHMRLAPAERMALLDEQDDET